MRKKIVATYDYRDQHGDLMYQTVRTNPKGFYQRRPDGNGNWIDNIQGIERLPYRLPELVAAPKDSIVFVPEGEKDVDRLRSLGLTATCNSGGAEKFHPDTVRWF